MSARDYVHAVRMDKIQMAFGNVVALRDVDLEVGANEIVGLIGDNGAGKSTLIKIITGVLRPTGGRLYLRDQLIDPERYSVRRAHDLRIEAVHQEKSLADKQPLWRNLFVGRQIANRLGFIDVSAGRRRSPTACCSSRSAFAAPASTPSSPWATSPAASARASRSAARCISTPT